MSDNIVSFKEALGKQTLDKLKRLLIIFDQQSSNDAIDFRCSMFPSFNNLSADQLFKVDSGFLSIMDAVRGRIEKIGTAETLGSETFKEYINICIHNMDNGWPCQLTVPFTSQPIVIHFLPYLDGWVITEVFIGHKSAIQKSYEMFADVFELNLEEIFLDIELKGRD